MASGEDRNSLYEQIQTRPDDWMKMACAAAFDSVRAGGGPFGAGGGYSAGGFGGQADADFGDILSQMFGRGAGPRGGDPFGGFGGGAPPRSAAARSKAAV